MFKKLLFISLCIFSVNLIYSQQEFTRADTLRGSITPERAWFDVTYYDLKVAVNPSEKTIEGSNTISYKVLTSNEIMQIDLQAPMKIDKIIQNEKEISFTSEGNAHFLKLQKKQHEGNEEKLTIYFSGKPIVARRPPWMVVLLGLKIATEKILLQPPMKALAQVFGGL